MKKFGFLFVLMLLTALPFTAQDDNLLVVITWNAESGDADADVLADQIASYADVDLWGFVEVESAADADVFELAAEDGRGAEFGQVLSESGDEDRMLILYNAERFELLDTDELDYINPNGRVRSPLVALLLDNETEQMFAFMVNHLKARTDYESRQLRHEQAQLLNEWAVDAAELELPVIAVGDYNFYYEVDGSGYDEGLDIIQENGAFEWVEPVEIINTQCTAQGNGCRYNSVVDFIFVSGDAQNWNGISEIIVTEGDFPDDETTSDHRPVMAVFELGG